MLFYQRKLLIALAIIFALVMLIASYNPMQSDDFGFYIKGLSAKAHIDLYMHWSGRVIVDYISSAILLLNQPLLKAFISSLALPWMIFNLATIPYYQDKSLDNKVAIFAFIILFISYWLGNPALGQTTFWIVGEANYLWPLVFVSAYIKYLLKYLHKEKIVVKHYFIISLLALLAGCSNEATGALVLYITALLALWALNNKLPHLSLSLVAFVIAFIGFAILLLAPGNMERAANPEYAQWFAIPLLDRIKQHVSRGMWGILESYGVIYVVLIWAFSQAKSCIKQQDWQLISIFASATLVFAFILVASPHAFLARTQLTGLFFLLVTLAFPLKVIFCKRFSGLAKLLIGCFVITFIASYILVLLAYQSIYRQSQIRIAIIEKAKLQAKQNIIIPNYYKPFTLRQGDLAELDYHSADMMGQYYGVKSIQLVFVGFDYEQILTSPCKTNYKALTNDATVLQCFYAYKNFITGETTFVVKFNQSIQFIKDTKRHFRLTVTNNYAKTDDLHYEISFPLRIIQIGNEFFASANAVTNLLALNKNPHVKVNIDGPITGKEFIKSKDINMIVQ